MLVLRAVLLLIPLGRHYGPSDRATNPPKPLTDPFPRAFSSRASFSSSNREISVASSTNRSGSCSTAACWQSLRQRSPVSPCIVSSKPPDVLRFDRHIPWASRLGNSLDIHDI